MFVLVFAIYICKLLFHVLKRTDTMYRKTYFRKLSAIHPRAMELKFKVQKWCCREKDCPSLIRMVVNVDHLIVLECCLNHNHTVHPRTHQRIYLDSLFYHGDSKCIEEFAKRRCWASFSQLRHDIDTLGKVNLHFQSIFFAQKSACFLQLTYGAGFFRCQHSGLYKSKSNKDIQSVFKIA